MSFFTCVINNQDLTCHEFHGLFYFILIWKFHKNENQESEKNTSFLVCENVTLSAKLKTFVSKLNGLEGYTWMKVRLFWNKLS